MNAQGNTFGNTFGYWLRRRRKALDLTQDALAARVSCSQAAIKKIEADERRPSRGLALRLAEHLFIPVPELAAFLAAARVPKATDALHLDKLPVYTLAAAADAPHDPPVHEGDLKFPFVGRAIEFGQFAGLLNNLSAANGYVVLMEGEAGIGKSRLTREVAHRAQTQRLPVLTTHCYEIERAIAYQPVIDLAAQACLATPADRLRAMAPTLLAEITALVPALAARLPDLPALSADLPEARQARLFQALLGLLDGLAQDHPLVVMVDDLQWADDASLRFLHFLARQVASRPVLFICAFRDDEVGANASLARLVESLRRARHAHPMALARLAQEDTEALLLKLNDPNLSAPDLAARLHSETGGNPFFLWSILHSLGEDAGALRDTARLPLPDALRDSVRMRLARVPEDDRQVLDLAAVLGRRFDFEPLLALAHAPEERFLHTLEALVQRRLLVEDPESGFYDFSHDKVREVVYRDIGAARRVLLHRAVAEKLEQQPQGEAHEHAARLAEHFERGKVWAKAVHYLSLAANHSQALFAMREALHWLDRAAALVQAHPEAATAKTQLAIYEQRGGVRAQAGRMQEAVADFQRVIDAARAQGEHAHARDVLIQLGMAHRRADAYEQAIACLDEALAISQATGDERHAADTLYHLGTVAWSNGRNELALAYHQQAVAICERLGLADLVAVQAFHGWGEACFANAEPVAAIASFTRSLDLARAIGDKSYEAENLMMIGWACTGHMGLADYPRALTHFAAALTIARAADLQWHLGPTLIGRAHVLMALGQFGTAWADLQEALPQLETLKLVRYQIMAGDALGCHYLDLNHADLALKHFEHGLALARDAAIQFQVARLQANLALAQLRLVVAHDNAALVAAYQYTDDHQERWMSLRCLEALAESALAQGDAAACVAYANQLSALASAGDLQEMQAQASYLRGKAALGGSAYESAHQELTLALSQAEKIGQIHLAWECHQALATVAAARGDAPAKAGHDSRARALADGMMQSLNGSGLTADLEHGSRLR